MRHAVAFSLSLLLHTLAFAGVFWTVTSTQGLPANANPAEKVVAFNFGEMIRQVALAEPALPAAPAGEGSEQALPTEATEAPLPTLSTEVAPETAALAEPEPEVIVEPEPLPITKPLPKPIVKKKPKPRKKKLKKKKKVVKKKPKRKKKTVVKKKKRIKNKQKTRPKKAVMAKQRRRKTKAKATTTKSANPQPVRGAGSSSRGHQLSLKPSGGRSSSASPHSGRPSAPSGSGASSRTYHAYRAGLQRAISRTANRHYPRKAKRMRKQGTVSVRFRLGRNGSISQVSVVRSSGNSSLDRGAIKALRRLGRYKPPPAGFPSSLTIAIRFRL